MSRPGPKAIGHGRKGVAYHVANSLRGLRRFFRLGYKRADRDLSITEDGVICVNHWRKLLLRDGFRDPLFRIKRDSNFNELTWDQVDRLRTFPGLYRVNTLRTDLAECARLGLEAVLEPKDDERFLLPDTWTRIKHIADETGAKVSVRVLQENNPGGRVVALASKHFKAWEIS